MGLRQGQAIFSDVHTLFTLFSPTLYRTVY